MSIKFLDSEIRRVSRNLLVVNLCLAFCIMAFGCFNFRYLYNFFQGPFLFGYGDLAEVKSPSDIRRYFVAVVGEEDLSSGVRNTRVTKDKYSGRIISKVTVDYRILVVDKRLLIVKYYDDLTHYPHQWGRSPFYHGTIEDISPGLKDHVIREAMKSKEMKKIKGVNPEEVFFPFILNTEDFRTQGFMGIFLLLPILLLTLWSLRNWYVRRLNPSLHPIVKHTNRYGSYDDVADDIDREISDSACKQFHKCRVTRSWILSSSLLSLNFVKLIDIVWVYRSDFDNISMKYEVVVCTCFERSFYVDLDRWREGANALIAELKERAPCAYFGYSKDLEKRWQKDTRGFIASVQEKRWR